MPKKAVAIFFLLAFIGAVIYVYFTFPRTKEEIPTSNNQRPFPATPAPAPNAPNSVPVPETAPHPTPPKVPPGPTLRVMAWASASEASALEAEADAFETGTGRHVSLTVESDEADYRRDLQQALVSESPPDVCLVAARDFSGLDPARDLAEVKSRTDIAPRSVAAFTVDGQIKAAPDEFSVEMLFYNPTYFDQAGIGYPDRHWNWDILEADTRALKSLRLKDASGRPIYPLELPADFDFWNILCTQAGHPALDQGAWHLADTDTKDSQMRALDFIHEIFQELSVTAPLPSADEPAGRRFAQQGAALLIGPSDLTATLPPFAYKMTLLPQDMTRASLARVNGWAVPTASTQTEAAGALAEYLAYQPVHAGWNSVQKPAEDDSAAALCYEAMGAALVPRIEPKTVRMAEFLDRQINQLARQPEEKTDALYARIQTEYQSESPQPLAHGSMKPSPKVEGAPQLRGF